MSDLYVDPQSGNDSTGDGSTGTPWKSLQKAIDNASGGDTIHMANTAADVLSSPISWSSGWGGGASVDNPLIITAWDNGGSLTISHPYASYSCWELNGDDAVATLFSTTSIPQYVCLVRGKFHSTTGILLDLKVGWNVLCCELYDAGATGMIDHANYTHIVGCYLHDFPANCYGIRTGWGSVIGNYIDSPTSYACWISTNVLAQGNIIRNAESRGIYVVGDHTQVLNNTIVGTTASAARGIYIESVAARVFVLNNIITDFSGANGRGIYAVDGSNLSLIGHNHFYNNTTDKSGVVVKGLDLGGDVYTNPGFVDAAGGDFRIGTAGKAKGWPRGWPGSATLNFMDTGAAQRLEQAMIRVGMSGGMNG